MSSILNVASTPTTTPTPRPTQPEPAANTPQPTLTQLLEEPAYELHLQALEGNPQAAELYTQAQASAGLLGGGVPGTGGYAIDFLA